MTNVNSINNQVTNANIPVSYTSEHSSANSYSKELPQDTFGTHNKSSKKKTSSLITKISICVALLSPLLFLLTPKGRQLILGNAGKAIKKA